MGTALCKRSRKEHSPYAPQMDDSLVITRTWAAVLSLAVLLVILGLLHAITRARGAGDDQRPEHLRRRRAGIKSLVIGTDGRASTSKLQAALWTIAVLYAFVFLLLWGRSTRCGESAFREQEVCESAVTARQTFSRVVNSDLQPEYYVLLGFPLAAAVAARAITTAKIADGTIQKAPVEEDTKGVVQGIAEVVSNDQGEIDLIDMQYVAFNFLTLSFFFVEFLTKPHSGLPDLPATLIALSGVSAGVYTTRKALAQA
jgi:hypothetical protein